MSIRRPVVGITPTPSTSTFDHGTFYRYCLSDTYVNAVWQAGGSPVIIPWVADQAESILDNVDALIVSGGGDIESSRFAQELHPEAGGIDEQRDAFEISLTLAAIERNLPLLAICRGIQVMNVAFGGSLHQHVPDLGGEIEHRQHNAGFSQHEPSHEVRFEDTPNPIEKLLGSDRVMVNSYHHQALAEVASPLKIAGRASDGVIEAVWYPDAAFAIGVQWHPEMLASQHEDHARLFEGLVEAARSPVATAR